MTTAARAISILFATPPRRSTAKPALGLAAPSLPRSARSAFAQSPSGRSSHLTPAFQSVDNRQPPPSPTANRRACANTTRALSP
jgi:hypothetical protein